MKEKTKLGVGYLIFVLVVFTLAAVWFAGRAQKANTAEDQYDRATSR